MFWSLSVRLISKHAANECTDPVPTDDFDARSGDELTLRRSDRVELIELDDGFGDGWYLGKHLTRGGTGLFPGGMHSPQHPVRIWHILTTF